MSSYNTSTGLLDIEETPFRLFQADDAIITNTILYRGLILDPSLQIVVDDLSGVVSTLTNDITDVSGRVFQNENDITDVSGRVLQNENDITDVSGRVFQNENDITDVSGRVFQNENDITDVSGRVFQNENDITDVSGRVFQNENDITDVSGRLFDLSGVVNIINDDYVSKTTNTAQAISSGLNLGGLVATSSGIRLNGGVPATTTNTLYYDPGSFGGFGAGLKYDTLNISQFNDRINLNEGNITGLTNSLNNLSGVVDDLSVNVGVLGGEIDTLELEVDDLSGVVLDLSGVVDGKVNRSGDTMTGDLSISKTTPRFSLSHTGGVSAFQEVRSDGYWYLNVDGNDLLSGVSNAINFNASAGAYFSGNLVFSGDNNDVVISKTGPNGKSLRLQAGDDASAPFDEFAIELITRDGNPFNAPYTALRVNGKSQLIEINRDLTIDDSRGVIFEGSTTPSVTTNKLYRSGSNIFWNGNQLDGGTSGDITDLSGVVFDLSGVVFDLSGNVNTLELEVDDLSGVVFDLSGDVNTLELEVDDLSGVVFDLSGNVGVLDDDLNLLDSRVGALETDVIDLSNRRVFYDDLEILNDDATNDYGLFFNAVSSLGTTGEIFEIRKIDNNVIGTDYLSFYEGISPSLPTRVQVGTNLWVTGDISGQDITTTNITTSNVVANYLELNNNTPSPTTRRLYTTDGTSLYWNGNLLGNDDKYFFLTTDPILGLTSANSQTGIDSFIYTDAPINIKNSSYASTNMALINKSGINVIDTQGIFEVECDSDIRLQTDTQTLFLDRADGSVFFAFVGQAWSAGNIIKMSFGNAIGREIYASFNDGIVFNTNGNLLIHGSNETYRSNGAIGVIESANTYIKHITSAQIEAQRDGIATWSVGCGAFGGGFNPLSGNGNWAGGHLNLLFAHDKSNGNMVIAGGLTQNSDRRIKKNIEPIDDNESLTLLRKIEAYKYNYIDKSKGTEKVYGWIAQNVREHFEPATSLSTQVIPNVLKEVDISGDIIKLKEATDADIKIGQQILIKKLVDEDDFDFSNIKVFITEKIDSLTYRVSYNYKARSGLFYGNFVDDFVQIQKEKLVPILWSACQQLDKKIETRDEKIAELKLKMAGLEGKIEILTQALLKAGLI